MNKDLKIYTSSSCSYCHKALDYLKTQEISHVNKDIDLFDEEFSQLVLLTGIDITPMIVKGTTILLPGRDYVEFDEITYALMLNDSLDAAHTSHQKIFEKLKTFEYNMTEAMQYILDELEKNKE